MCKAAIYSSYSTYEDSTRMTQGAAEKMCASITKEESVILDKNSNVDKIVEIGQNVEVGDDLITFEPGFDEEIFNDLLVSVGDRFNVEIKSIGKQKVDSHYQGKIVDIKSMKSDKEIREYFATVLPDFDDERVYTNDIKKVFSWYNILVEAGMTEFKIEEDAKEE